MIRLFIDAGFLWMSLLTLEFIGLLLAAWKAPGWVKEIGAGALITGIIGFLVGFYQMAEAVQGIGEVSMVLIFGGLKIASVTVIYGCLIYAAMLVIRIIQKPKLL